MIKDYITPRRFRLSEKAETAENLKRTRFLLVKNLDCMYTDFADYPEGFNHDWCDFMHETERIETVRESLELIEMIDRFIESEESQGDRGPCC